MSAAIYNFLGDETRIRIHLEHPKRPFGEKNHALRLGSLKSVTFMPSRHYSQQYINNLTKGHREEIFFAFITTKCKERLPRG